MDITRIPEGNQAFSGATASPVNRQEAHQATATPTILHNHVPVTALQAEQSVAINDAELKRSLEAINRFLKPANGELEFSIDDESNRMVVKVVDTETQKVLRQMPSKEAIAIAKELDRLQGLLVRDKA